LKGLDARYELYLIITALEDPSVNNLETRKEEIDALHMRLFNTAFQLKPSTAGLDYMYASIVKSHSIDQQKQLIGQFTLLLYTLCKGKQFKGSLLTDYCFGQDMIDQAQEYFVAAIAKELPSGPFENIGGVM
jgi:hypothetical protein